MARLLSLSLVLTLVGGAGCSCDSSNDDGDASGARGGSGQSSGGSASGGNGGSAGSMGQFMGTGGATPACVNLECQQVHCESGQTTTVSGTVYEPAGNVPLYNVAVYVPNSPVEPLTDGASCTQCGGEVTGSPLVSAITDASGHFVLSNVPVGDDIPLVVQVGKWRRELTIPTVAECTDTPLVDGSVRLPRNQSEGHIPRIALSTGGADPLECWLPKIGIDLAEFTNPDGNGRINLFAGSGGTVQYADGTAFPNSQAALWNDAGNLSVYDIVLLACEAGWNEATKGPAAISAMNDYANMGGRIFASHWHNYWVENGLGMWPQVADFDHQADLANPFDALVDTTFPKGQAFGEWLVNVGASTQPGVLTIKEAQHTINTVNPQLSTQWIYSDNPVSVQYLSFNTPLEVAEDQRCGRLVLSDIHVSSGDQIGVPFPNGCQTTELSPQEKALLFMLFDLSSCIIPDDEPPCAPGHAACGNAGDPPCNGTCQNGCCEEIAQ
ncbi:MAG: carboxypeptidase-like regulatory domain-containing protein [Polyangiaceae bacterium]